MKIKYLIILVLALTIFATPSCRKDKMFEQPSIEVVDFELKELPSEYTYLEIDILRTKDAVFLLSKLDAGEELDYSAIGTFHVEDGIPKLFDLPLDVAGTASVNVGYENFYNQPDVTVDEISVEYAQNEDNSFTFNFDVACTAKNMDARNVTIEEIEYVVNIENIPSNTHFYSDAYSSDLTIDGNGTKALNLPVSLNLNATEGDTLAQAVEEGIINYTVEGTFHAIKVDETDADFLLPLYLTGCISGNVVNDLFEQPTIEVTGYTLKRTSRRIYLFRY